MIQRKQTLYLLLALAAMIVCLCLPIGRIEPAGMGVATVWYNVGLYGSTSFVAHPILFVDLVVAGALSLVTIFLYHHRRAQMRLCTVSSVLCVLWYACYLFCVYAVTDFQAGTFHVGFAACLPFVALVFLILAHRGVKADDDLVKSMDRIR